MVSGVNSGGYHDVQLWFYLGLIALCVNNSLGKSLDKSPEKGA